MTRPPEPGEWGMVIDAGGNEGRGITLAVGSCWFVEAYARPKDEAWAHQRFPKWRGRYVLLRGGPPDTMTYQEFLMVISPDADIRDEEREREVET